MITIILTDTCVSASVGKDYIPLGFLLPALQQSFLGDSTGFTKVYDLICHISDVYMGEEALWKDSHSGSMVCKCVLCVIVFYLFVFL